MTIGTALVLVAILYLIDKHNLWKRAAAVCLIAFVVVLVGFAGHYGWQMWQERKARTETGQTQRKAQEALASQYYEVVGEEPPNWDIPGPPKGYILSDASFAILYPVKAGEKAKTNAWEWYRDSSCATVGDSEHSENHVLHEHDLFAFDAYDDRWMSDINLPQEVKRALWSAKVAVCRLHPGSEGVKACLDRATGAVEVGPWVNYMTSCGPKNEMIYLNRGSQGTK